ncbi:MAG: E3 ubiquitin-protein ligase hrd1 [Geoglossum umbratile]|nr:MAG: E3 ubiquitin-protein ligase hrd1 [Geoglossum umbratile]
MARWTYQDPRKAEGLDLEEKDGEEGEGRGEEALLAKKQRLEADNEAGAIVYTPGIGLSLPPKTAKPLRVFDGKPVRALPTETSTVLAAGVVIRAFQERANFYSAAVYLSQSNACLTILTNLLLLCVAGVMFGLQRLLYRPPRPIEIEQLYEKALFAITETRLAMAIFREEVGGWFLVTFVALLVGEVWDWIREGRVELLEQQLLVMRAVELA